MPPRRWLGWALAAIGGPRAKVIVPLESPNLDHPLGRVSDGLNAAPIAGSHDPFRQVNFGRHRRSGLDAPDEFGGRALPRKPRCQS